MLCLRCLSRCAHRHVDVMCVVTFRLVAEVVEADHRLSFTSPSWIYPIRAERIGFIVRMIRGTKER